MIKVKAVIPKIKQKLHKNQCHQKIYLFPQTIRHDGKCIHKIKRTRS